MGIPIGKPRGRSGGRKKSPNPQKSINNSKISKKTDESKTLEEQETNETKKKAPEKRNTTMTDIEIDLKSFNLDPIENRKGNFNFINQNCSLLINL